MLRVDLQMRVVEASVLDLVPSREDLAAAHGPLGAARAALGSEIHRRYRARAEAEVPGFRGEVAVEGTHEVDGFTVHVRGRVDGLIEEPYPRSTRLVVEEVKSVDLSPRDLVALQAGDVPEASLQLRLYAWLLARERPDAEIRARLRVISIHDGCERVLEHTLRPVRTRQALERHIRRILRVVRDRDRRTRRNAARTGGLRFPYPQPRPGQLEMARFVEACLDAGCPALVEAPTGVGKTVAALLPALRFARARGALLYVLTAKRTQRARVAATFQDLADAAGGAAGTLRGLTLRPRTAMCPPGGLLCHPQYCAYLANLRDRTRRVSALEALLGRGEHIDAQDVFALGREETLCPHLLSLLLCARVDVAIGDFNHVYGTVAPPGLFPGELLPRPVIVVVDEAHNLFDRARDYDSPFLPVAHVRDALERSRPSHMPEMRAYLESLRRTIEATIRRAVADGAGDVDGCRPVRHEEGVWERLAADAARLLLPHAARAAAHGIGRAADPVLELLERVGRVRDLLARDDPALVPYASAGVQTGVPRGVGICCVDPSTRLRARHREVLGTVAMSATFSPVEHYGAVLGFDPSEARFAAYPSPFAAEQRCVTVVPTVSTTWRARHRHFGEIARLIERVIAVRPGHYVAYFPSFAFLEAVRSRLGVADAALLVQQARMDDDERAAVLARLEEDPAPLLLLAVAGGVFAEGVDLPGPALIGAVVVGPALPRAGFERTAMRQYFDATIGGGFARSMLHPGMQRVVQAAGRVHRTPEDDGVIVLLGRRFAQPPYVDCLPAYWSRYGIEELVAEDPVPRLERFWQGATSGDRA